MNNVARAAAADCLMRAIPACVDKNSPASKAIGKYIEALKVSPGAIAGYGRDSPVEELEGLRGALLAFGTVHPNPGSGGSTLVDIMRRIRPCLHDYRRGKCCWCEFPASTVVQTQKQPIPVKPMKPVPIPIARTEKDDKK